MYSFKQGILFFSGALPGTTPYIWGITPTPTYTSTPSPTPTPTSTDVVQDICGVTVSATSLAYELGDELTITGGLNYPTQIKMSGSGEYVLYPFVCLDTGSFSTGYEPAPAVYQRVGDTFVKKSLSLGAGWTFHTTSNATPPWHVSNNGLVTGYGKAPGGEDYSGVYWLNPDAEPVGVDTTGGRLKHFGAANDAGTTLLGWDWADEATIDVIVRNISSGVDEIVVTLPWAEWNDIEPYHISNDSTEPVVIVKQWATSGEINYIAYKRVGGVWSQYTELTVTSPDEVGRLTQISSDGTIAVGSYWSNDNSRWQACYWSLTATPTTPYIPLNNSSENDSGNWAYSVTCHGEIIYGTQASPGFTDFEIDEMCYWLACENYETAHSVAKLITDNGILDPLGEPYGRPATVNDEDWAFVSTNGGIAASNSGQHLSIPFVDNNSIGVDTENIMYFSFPTAPTCEEAPEGLISDGYFKGFIGEENFLHFTDPIWSDSYPSGYGFWYEITKFSMSRNGKYVLVMANTVTGFTTLILERNDLEAEGFTVHEPNMTGITAIVDLAENTGNQEIVNDRIANNGAFCAKVTAVSDGLTWAAVWIDGFDQPPTLHANDNEFVYITPDGRYTWGWENTSVLENRRYDHDTDTIEVLSGVFSDPPMACTENYICSYGASNINNYVELYQRTGPNTWVSAGFLAGISEDQYPNISDISLDGTIIVGQDWSGTYLANYWDLTIPAVDGIRVAAGTIGAPIDQEWFGEPNGMYVYQVNHDGSLICGSSSYGYPLFWTSEDNYATAHVSQARMNQSCTGPEVCGTSDIAYVYTGVSAYNPTIDYGLLPQMSNDGIVFCSLAYTEGQLGSKSLCWSAPLIPFTTGVLPAAGRQMEIEAPIAVTSFVPGIHHTDQAGDWILAENTQTGEGTFVGGPKLYHRTGVMTTAEIDAGILLDSTGFELLSTDSRVPYSVGSEGIVAGYAHNTSLGYKTGVYWPTPGAAPVGVVSGKSFNFVTLRGTQLLGTDRSSDTTIDIIVRDTTTDIDTIVTTLTLADYDEVPVPLFMGGYGIRGSAPYQPSPTGLSGSFSPTTPWRVVVLTVAGGVETYKVYNGFTDGIGYNQTVTLIPPTGYTMGHVRSICRNGLLVVGDVWDTANSRWAACKWRFHNGSAFEITSGDIIGIILPSTVGNPLANTSAWFATEGSEEGTEEPDQHGGWYVYGTQVSPSTAFPLCDLVYWGGNGSSNHATAQSLALRLHEGSVITPDGNEFGTDTDTIKWSLMGTQITSSDVGSRVIVLAKRQNGADPATYRPMLLTHCPA